LSKRHLQLCHNSAGGRLELQYLKKSSTGLASGKLRYPSGRPSRAEVAGYGESGEACADKGIAAARGHSYAHRGVTDGLVCKGLRGAGYGESRKHYSTKREVRQRLMQGFRGGKIWRSSGCMLCESSDRGYNGDWCKHWARRCPMYLVYFRSGASLAHSSLSFSLSPYGLSECTR